MKGFLTRMWEKNRLTEEKLRSYCPIFLTQATGVFCALALKGVIDPSQFMTVFVTIIGFYFGTQSARD